MASKRRRPVPPRGARVARSPRAPAAASLIYQLRLRRLVSAWRRKSAAELDALAKRFAELEDGQRAPAIKGAIARLKSSADRLAEDPQLGKAMLGVATQVARHNQAELDRLKIKPKAKRETRLDDKEAPKVKPSIGVKLPGELRPMIENWRDKNVGLITGALQAQADKIADVLHTHEGSRYEVIAKLLAERFEISERRAELIARDQVLTLNAQINQHRMQAAGISRYIWTTTGEERVRGNPDGLYPDSDEDHFSLDGQTFSFDDPPVVNEKTGERANPGEPINCRCTAYPVDDIFG